MKHNTTCRLFTALFLCLLFCLALGGAAAENGCGHNEMSFEKNDIKFPTKVMQYCEECGHSSYLTLEPTVVTEGESYNIPILTGGNNWDGPILYDEMVVAYYDRMPNPSVNALSTPPSEPGLYYAVVYYENRRNFFLNYLLITPRGHQHELSYTESAQSSSSITANCNCKATGTITLNAARDTTGKTKVTLTTSGIWLGEFPEILYFTQDGVLLNAFPQEEGDYSAQISLGSCTAEVNFTLDESDIAITPVPVPGNRIVPNVPHGLKFAKQTIEDGQYHMVISQEDTDWGNMVAQLFDTQRQMMIWQTPHIVPYPGATRYAYISASSATVDAAVEALLNQSSDVHISMIGGNATLAMHNLGSYMPASGLFSPSDSKDVTTYVLGWYKDNKLIAIELLKSSITFDNGTPFIITENKLGTANILPALNLNQDAVSAMEIVKDDNSVSYRADSTALLNTSVIETGILLPQAIANKAATCEIRYDAFKAPTTVQVDTIDGKPGIVITSDLPTNGSAKGYSYALVFKDAQGAFVKAYNLTVTIRMGESVPFPLYHSDWNAIPASRIQLQVTSESGSVPAGLGLSYNANHGIINYDIDSRALPRDRSLDGVLGTVHILPPEGARGYRMYPPFESGISVRPDMYSMSNDDSLHAEERIAKSPLTAMNGFFGRNIEFPFLQGYEVDLIDGHTYTLYDLGLPNMGELGAGFRLIYWYENESDELPMLKEYVLVTHDPASAPDFTTPALEENDLSEQDAAFPRMVISREDESGRRYLFYSDIVPQTSDNELHYELRLTDEQGNPVSTETLSALAPLTIYIPVPDGVDAYDPDLTFSVSHLNANSTKVTETFSVKDKTLVVTEYGLCFTVDSLSPFVLSWDTEAPDTSSLPQTGDNSPALFMLLIILFAGISPAFFAVSKKRV